MRRLLAAFLALSLASSASAKVLVISGRNPSLPDSDPAGWLGRQAVELENIQALQVLGVDYDVLQAGNQSVKTEYCRTGTFVFDGGRTVTYDAIVHLGGVLVGASGRGYRPDSLTLIGNSTAQKYTRVPQIYINWNGTNLSEAAACSTLSSHWDNTNLTNTGQTNYSPSNPTLTYQSGVAKNSSLTTGASSGASWPGGIRVLLRTGVSAGIRQWSIATPVAWRDSLWQRIPSFSPFGTEDSFVVMAKKLDTIPSCNGAAYIFINDHDNSENQRDHIPFLAALAYADSLTSGAILGTAKRTPLKLAFQIRGGFSRGTQLGYPTSTGGMTTTDSTNFIATIDSLNALDVPLTLGVNVDSIATYTNFDKRWWARAPQVKYGVWQRGGLDSTAVSGAASFQQPRDILGRLRKRAAYGDTLLHTAQTGDTSITQLVRSAFWKLDSTFGAGKVDRVLMVPGDDWSPLTGSFVGRDSVIYAMSLGGARGLTVNPVASITRGVGYDAFAQNDPIIYAPSRGPFKLLVTAGPADSGSTSWDAGLGSGAYLSRFYFAENQWRAALGITNRAWYVPPGLYFDTATQAGPEVLKFPGTARIITLHCSDLQSGLRSDAATVPLRPGYWTIKNMVNGARIVNSFGWQKKPLIVFTYPGEIEL